MLDECWFEKVIFRIWNQQGRALDEKLATCYNLPQIKQIVSKLFSPTAKLWRTAEFSESANVGASGKHRVMRETA